jgi:hypothetical protein
MMDLIGFVMPDLDLGLVFTLVFVFALYITACGGACCVRKRVTRTAHHLL